MHIVEEQEFCEKAYPAFSQVFYSNVDGDYHFAESILSRVILDETFAGSINDAIPMKIIIAAAREIGDDGCYFHLPYPNPREPDFYYVPFDELLEVYEFLDHKSVLYQNKKIRKKVEEWLYRFPIAGSGSTVMYSKSGQWGIATQRCCNWGILGGTVDFTNELKRYLPMLDRQIFSFLFAFYVECNSVNSDYSTQMEATIGSDLVHIYGIEQASKIIKMTPKELLERSGRDILDFVNPDFINKYTELI
jgi:hypothetical protein